MAGSHTAEQLVIDADLDTRDRERVRFLVENVAEAVAPSNVPLVNPVATKAAIDTAGLSLVRGGKQLVKDLASAPRGPEMVDGSGFVLGDNIAATPGAVVLRTVLSTSGHIAALVNPPGNPKASYHTNQSLTSDAKVWLKGSDLHQGTWWTDIGLWLDERCGQLRPAPEQLGSHRLTVLADAPGTYVFDK